MNVNELTPEEFEEFKAQKAGGKNNYQSVIFAKAIVWAKGEGLASLLMEIERYGGAIHVRTEQDKIPVMSAAAGVLAAAFAIGHELGIDHAQVILDKKGITLGPDKPEKKRFDPEDN